MSIRVSQSSYRSGCQPRSVVRSRNSLGSQATPRPALPLGGFTGSKVTDPRTVDGGRPLDDVPGRPRVVTLHGHTPGSVGYLFADRGLLFTGDALVTYDGITGYRGPAVSSRAFTHDSRAALASLTALDAINAGLLLPGHGEHFPGTPADAAAQARSAGAR